MIYIGIDEAGRGPLIGDMVIAGVLVNSETLEKLEIQGLRESKQLSPNKRSRFYKQALRNGVVAIAVYVHPWRIDLENLNDVEEKCIEWILRVSRALLSTSTEGVRVYIDEVKGRSGKVKKLVNELFGDLVVEFAMEPRADAKYSPVALASVFAKVMRDRNLEELKKHAGNFGSGYPVDPYTKKWLRENYTQGLSPPLFVRRSWSVLKNAAPTWYRGKKRGKKAPKYRSLLDFAER